MSPVELRRYQAIQTSVKLLKAAHSAASIALRDLEEVHGLENEEVRREVDGLLAQLRGLVVRPLTRG